MGRLVSAAAVVSDQLDFYATPGGIVRVTGIVPASLSLKVFANNVLLAWTLEDGTLVPDSSVVAGKVYFNEIGSSPGFYSVRTFFDRTGFWRLVFTNPGLGVEIVKEYDVLPADSFRPSTGLNASFIKSC